MEVIDIPSSPEILPTVSRITRSQSRQPAIQKGRAPPPARWLADEIIEISDSDSEPAPRLVSPNKKRPENNAQERNASPLNVPVFGEPRANFLADLLAGPSQKSPNNERVAAVPLFYSENEDSEVQQVPQWNQVPDNFPSLVLPPPPPLEPLPQPSHPLEPPAAAADPSDIYVARVLEIVPDVEPAYVLGLVQQFLHHPNAVLELVLHSLFENLNYPKVDRKGKRKRTEDDEEGSVRGQPVPKIDYGATDREYKGGIHYPELALEQLMVDFPYAPKPYLRTQLIEHRFYAPTHLLLAQHRDPLPYFRKSVPSRVSGKGKAKHDAEFEAERQWLLQKLDAPVSIDGARPEESNDDACEECEDGIECGCCFSSYPFDKMVQCPEAHLFCKSCMSSYASNLLGEHNPNIVCMDQSGCKGLFPQSELERFLTPKLLELYHRVRQRKDIEAAGLENLEECPFCDYKCVIENEMGKLFRCENVDCGAVSCRECKKRDHLPKSCEEVESDKHLDVQHVVEEAMTRALMRNCPKCQKAFIKEHGCNKMTCPNCSTVSCYICRKVINGYEHFGNPNPYGGRADKSKCLLWDPVEQRHATEVQEAAKKAIEELKRDHPDVDASNIKIDVSIAGPAHPAPNMHPNMNRPLLMDNLWGIPAYPNVIGPIPAYGAAHAAHMQNGQQNAQQVQQRLRERMLAAERRQAEIRRQEVLIMERRQAAVQRQEVLMMERRQAAVQRQEVLMMERRQAAVQLQEAELWRQQEERRQAELFRQQAIMREEYPQAEAERARRAMYVAMPQLAPPPVALPQSVVAPRRMSARRR